MSVSLMDSGSHYASLWTRWLLEAGEANETGFIEATATLLRETYRADRVVFLASPSPEAKMRERIEGRNSSESDPAPSLDLARETLIVRFAHPNARIGDVLIERVSPPFSEEESRIALALERMSEGFLAARAESRDTSEEREILREFANLASTLDLVRIERDIVEKFGDIARAARCVLFLYHPNREALKPEAQRDAVGIQLSDHESPLLPLHSTDSLYQKLLSESLLESPVDDFPSKSLKSVLDYLGERNLMLLPLVHYGGLTGVIAWTAEPEAPSLSERRLGIYATVARQIAAAIENARSFEESERRIQDLSSLQRINQGLVSNLHLKEMLERALSEVVSAMEADSGSIMFYEPNDRTLRIEAAIGIPASVSRKTLVRLGEGIVGWLAIHREAQLLEDLEKDPRFKLIVPRPEIKSSMVAPILCQRKFIGALCVSTHSPGRRFNERDLSLTQTMAASIAVAIENATHYEDERQIAQIARDTLLPRLPLVIPGLDIGEKHAPSHDVGGDCYYLYDLGGGEVGILVSDVSGKGIPAAMHAAMGKHFIRALAHRCDNPAEALTHANVLVAKDTPPEIFITVFYGVLNVDTGDMVYCNAGHVPPIIVREDHSLAELNQTGMVIGLWEGMPYENARVKLRPGETLLCYTDGVTEARRDGELFGYDRLKSALTKHHQKSAQRIVDLIYRRTLAFCGKRTEDDLALLAIKRKPAA